MSGYERRTERGFLLSGREWSIVGGATGLMVLNVLVMYAFAATPVAAINQALFAVPILGAVVYGAAITAGQYVAERGVKRETTGLAIAGVALLQGAFGAFGAGVLAFLPRSAQLTALGIAGAITALMTVLIGGYVYARADTSFDHYSSWATYAFLGGLGAVLVGSFFAPLLLAGFVLIFLGFLLRLGWEIWQIREGSTRAASLQAIGLYVAVAGVFVHVLQLVIRAMAER